MNDKTKDGQGKTDLDSLDVLPLSLISLASSTLKSARLIKNSRLETTVELYNDPIAGSLQIHPADIADQIAASARDQEIVARLAELPSYDIYSLRASLKRLGIEVENDQTLELSSGMKEALSDISLQFTRPLIETIFGAEKMEISDTMALQKMFRDPDVARVRENLKIMTERTGIPMADLPKFLQDYSDVFLSVAYYRYSFESILPEVDRFMSWIKDLREHKDVAGSPQTAQSCKKVEETVRFLYASVRERLLRFQFSFETFWKDINPQSFAALRKQIEENHSTMGPILCGLSVKVGGWAREFPDNNVGGPQKRAKYAVTEIEPGLETLKMLETEARRALGLQK